MNSFFNVCCTAVVNSGCHMIQVAVIVNSSTLFSHSILHLLNGVHFATLFLIRTISNWLMWYHFPCGSHRVSRTIDSSAVCGHLCFFLVYQILLIRLTSLPRWIHRPYCSCGLCPTKRSAPVNATYDYGQLLKTDANASWSKIGNICP